MSYMFKTIKPILNKTGRFLTLHKYHVGALLLIIAWTLPYFTSGNKLDWGDFSFFVQAYHAMYVSIVDFGQFPWMNPWISGGVPLYANPQIGVFSPQMLLVLIFGAPLGLKIALALYTFAGYGSMYILLRRFFKIDKAISVLLSLLWIFCTFFVAHLPGHFTFAWYLLAPFFIYLALTVKTWRGGLVFGGAFAVMALSQIHNPFVHIGFICGIIILARFIRERKQFKTLALAMVAAALVFTVLAGHRFLYTYENVKDFPRTELFDPAPVPQMAALGPFLPYSVAHPFSFINYPTPPLVPHLYGEVTATLGLGAVIAGLVGLLFVAYKVWQDRQNFRQLRLPMLVFGGGLLCFLIALGDFAPWAPYTLLKMLPVISDMRVSTRWFLGFDLALLIFIGLAYKQAPARSFARFALTALLVVGVAESFVANVGYSGRVLSHPPVLASKKISAEPFEQTFHFTSQFLPTTTMPDHSNVPIPNGELPGSFHEFEAMTYNLGTLFANDALLELHREKPYIAGHRATCPWERDCEFVRSGNAKVTYWSPQKVILERTAPGPIQLDMNNSNYFVINGQRNTKLKVAEPFTPFIIDQPDSVKTIEVKASPSLAAKLLNKLHR